MITHIRKLLTPPVFEDEEQMRIAGILNSALMIVFGGTLVGTLLITPFASSQATSNLVVSLVMCALTAGLWLLLRRGLLRQVGALLSFLLWTMVTLFAITGAGIRDPSLTGYFLVVALVSLVLGKVPAAIAGSLCILSTLGIAYAEISNIITISVPDSVQFADVTLLILSLGLTTGLLRSAVHSITEGYERAHKNERTLAESYLELQDIRASLEQRVAERTRGLQAAAEVASVATSVLNPDELLEQVVTRINELFNLYHTSVFLLDDTGRWAEYRAGSGDVGRFLRERGFRLEINDNSMVGWCIGHAEPRIAFDVNKETGYYKEPLLPDTSSEASLPLVARGRVIGALNVQSVQKGTFAEEIVTVMQTMANQVAVAIDNARLFVQSQAAMEAERRAYGELGRQGWIELLRTHTDWGYRYTQGTVVPTMEDWRPEMLQSTQTGQKVLHKPDLEKGDGAEETALVIPLRVRDQVIGALNFRKGERGGTWTAEETSLLETLVEQLGVALDSARLHQDTLRHAAQEQLTREITARMRETFDMDMVIQTAIREMGDALNIAKVEVRMGNER